MSKSIAIRLAVLSALILLSGCGHKTYYDPPAQDRFYTPKQIPIKSGMILDPEYNITKTVTLINAQTDAENVLLGSFTHPWWGNLKAWTHTAVGLVKNEFQKRDVEVTSQLPLILKLEMDPEDEPVMWAGTLMRGCPLDPDADGIPEYLDRCPDTPSGVMVDSRGCPVDTDGDSVPDYRDYCPRIPQGFRIDHEGYGRGGQIGSGGGTTGAFESFCAVLVSSRPADQVMDLFKQALEREDIPLTDDEPDMLRFSMAPGGWEPKWEFIRTSLAEADVQLTGIAPKILQLSITHAALSWEPRSIACTLNLRVITGDGDVLDFRGTNSAIDLEDSCDGAVTRQVTAMFRDRRILAYLEAPPEPKDSDCDGVPDDTDECPNTPLGVVVDERGCSLDSDGDGVPDYLDECPGTPQGVEVDPRGCPLDTDEDGVFDYKDKCPNTPKGARVDMEGCWVIHEPLFDFDKSKIKPRYYSVLDDVVKVLQQNPSVRIVIQGHTDNIGTEAYNQKLSEERARAVEQYLIQKGITEERLKTVGYGSSRPKATNKTDAGRALNRRVKLEPLPGHPKQAK
ncbi:MAG: OmpA family protein [Deltaproteobacteria bacterium]|nr:OmpA family protein [Deltaproteobacteria bacterium]